ncbi:MAG: UDP-glucose 4-epimerase GalE [Desulfuromusa sp.]|nr:UDP-glucose 4-epimerase GalE [Desulfuromusa sp.]
MNILVCGGAGYIGSHMVKMLSEQGHQVTVFDNFSTGNRWAVKWGKLYEGDLLNKRELSDVFERNSFNAVMHFSARSLVGESVENPALYYQNNVIGTLNLLAAMQQAEVKDLIFSSTAATFGHPFTDRIDENHPQQPINPYGWTKLMIEQILQDYASAYGVNSVSLRYFNAAGADPAGEIGEAHDPETHLIPNILKSVSGEKRLKVFGADYPTPDGTCVRDYIHINDLCSAHLLALKYLDSHAGAYGFNLGNGQGFSIMEILQAAIKVVGNKIPYDVEGRRSGDPPTLVADSALARQELGWQPLYITIESIIETAWNWQKKSHTYGRG